MTAIVWSPREPPLAACGVIAWGAAAELLAARVPTEVSLSALASEEALLLLGETGELPWVDGVVYLGRDDSAPELLLPTTLSPSVPLDLLARALRKRLSANGPLAIVPRGAAVEVFSLNDARSVTGAQLASVHARA
jgi:hypothetical protein